MKDKNCQECLSYTLVQEILLIYRWKKFIQSPALFFALFVKYLKVSNDEKIMQ